MCSISRSSPAASSRSRSDSGVTIGGMMPHSGLGKGITDAITSAPRVTVSSVLRRASRAVSRRGVPGLQDRPEPFAVGFVFSPQSPMGQGPPTDARFRWEDPVGAAQRRCRNQQSPLIPLSCADSQPAGRCVGPLENTTRPGPLGGTKRPGRPIWQVRVPFSLGDNPDSAQVPS